MLGIRSIRFRSVAVEVATTVGTACVAAATRVPISTGWRTLAQGELATAPFDGVLVQGCAAVLLLCSVWLWFVTTMVVVEALRGASAPRAPRGVPTVVRRWVLAACGVALAGGAISPAWAAPVPGHGGTHHHAAAAVSVLDGLPYPDRAVGGPPRAATPQDRTHLVVAGDTLWAIAAAELPPDVGDAAIAERWHAVYAANRTVLGPDPDLIEPGQLLHLPGKDRT